MLSELVQEGAIFGGGSFILSSIMSVITNSQKNDLAKWKYATNYQAEDVKDAREKDFKFTRRLIVLSLFLFIPIICYMVAKNGLITSIPYVEKSSILWGMFTSKSMQIKEATGFVLLAKPISDLMWSVSGFYFGSKFKH